MEEWDKYIESRQKFKALVYIKQAIAPFVVARKVYNLSWLLSVMPSFREIRGLLLLLHGSNFFRKRKFYFFFTRNISLPTCLFKLEFDLDDMENDECLVEFRIKKQDLETLAEALQRLESFHCQQ